MPMTTTTTMRKPSDRVKLLEIIHTDGLLTEKNFISRLHLDHTCQALAHRADEGILTAGRDDE
jgi:hypothetical protein